MRVSTGLKKLDKMLGGGFPQNSVVLLSGGPGTGKTLLSLKYILDGAKKGEKCCYVTLNETVDDVLKACDSVKSLSTVKKYLNKNLAIEHISMGQSNVSIKRFAEIISQYPKIDRIVIDNVNKLLMFSDTKKSYRSYMVEILNTLREAKSSLIICETSNEDALDSGNFEAFECDGVVQLIFLDLEEKPMRSIMVHKMRYTSFDPKIPHELKVSSSDIDVTETKII